MCGQVRSGQSQLSFPQGPEMALGAVGNYCKATIVTCAHGHSGGRGHAHRKREENAGRQRQLNAKHVEADSRVAPSGGTRATRDNTPAAEPLVGVITKNL